jgi:hypothetical protein
LGVIIKQPVFIVAVSSAAVGYVIMSYIMTATPISIPTAIIATGRVDKPILGAKD